MCSDDERCVQVMKAMPKEDVSRKRKAEEKQLAAKKAKVQQPDVSLWVICLLYFYHAGVSSVSSMDLSSASYTSLSSVSYTNLSSVSYTNLLSDIGDFIMQTC